MLIGFPGYQKPEMGNDRKWVSENSDLEGPRSSRPLCSLDLQVLKTENGYGKGLESIVTQWKWVAANIVLVLTEVTC